EWTPRDVDPELASEQALVRGELGLAAQPTTVVVSASGNLDLGQRGLASPDVPVLIATSERGARALAPAIADERLAIARFGASDVDTIALLGTLDGSGARLVLCEGGPHLLGDLLRGRRVDELFLTLAPQLAGLATDRHRLGLVEEMAFGVADAPWASLV